MRDFRACWTQYSKQQYEFNWDNTIDDGFLTEGVLQRNEKLLKKVEKHYGDNDLPLVWETETPEDLKTWSPADTLWNSYGKFKQY